MAQEVAGLNPAEVTFFLLIQFTLKIKSCFILIFLLTFFTSCSKKNIEIEITRLSKKVNETSGSTNSNGSGNVYVIDGVQKKSLTLNAGTTYTFNHSSSHPFRFSTTEDGTHGGGSEYTTGVTTSSGSTVIWWEGSSLLG